jgi:hypothetical protein
LVDGDDILSCPLKANDPVVKTDPAVVLSKKSSVVPPPLAVDVIVTEPFDAVVIVTFVPATK